MTSSPTSQNRLASETSPYLLQHKDNPVHWWAWGPEALAEAKRTNRPILLSVGYAACHWCHVMAHESFEDAAIAARDERAVRQHQGRPRGAPRHRRHLHARAARAGRAGRLAAHHVPRQRGEAVLGRHLLPADAALRPARLRRRCCARCPASTPRSRDKVAHNAGLLRRVRCSQRASRGQRPRRSTTALLADLTRRMVARRRSACMAGCRARRSSRSGASSGCCGAAPSATANEARQARRRQSRSTHICQGGIYDHLGGGFARYSVDERWLVPHFEKMLYDNALLIDLMCEACRETGKDALRRAASTRRCGWVLREMMAEGGGFAASLDADCEGEEGKFYVWTQAEIDAVLGEADARVLRRGLRRHARPATGKATPSSTACATRCWARRPRRRRWRSMRAKLLARRAKRVRPGWDDKVLADWNGLMIAALAHAARVFDRPEWLHAAATAFSFVARSAWRRTAASPTPIAPGQAKVQGTASDYANMIWGALRLLQATNERAFLAAAERWCATLDKHFWVADGGGYAFTADDTPDVIVRMRGAHDDATPNANAIMISNLVALHLLTGKPAYLERAHAIPQAFAADLRQQHARPLRPARRHLRPDRPAARGGDQDRRRRSDPRSWPAPCSSCPCPARCSRSLPATAQHLHGRPRSPARPPSTWPAHRLRLPRPAMLAAGDGAGRPARGAARAEDGTRRLIQGEVMSIAIASRFADVNGTSLHYLIAGQGDPVLLLHGYAQTSHMWRPLIAELAKTHTVIAPDLRGFGDSAKPEGGYDKKTMAQDIHALATSLGLQARRRRRPRHRPDGRLRLRRAVPGRGRAHRADGRLPARRRRLDERLAAARPVALPFLRQDAAGAGRPAASASTSSISGTTSPPTRTHSVSEADRQFYAAAYAQPGAMRAGFEVFRAFEQDAKDFAALRQDAS